jgi:signal transduction histidine kinase
MDDEQILARYHDLQRYIGWTEADLDNVHEIAPLVKPHVPRLVDSFYDEIERHEATRRVFTGGANQIARLRQALVEWLDELVSGIYDSAYVVRRWKVGLRHVQIGLGQEYTTVALGRIRGDLVRAIVTDAPRARLPDWLATLDRLLDLDLALMGDAYQYEHVQRLKRGQRLAAIGQMAAGIAHELRNPLNVIRTSVFYLQNARDLAPAKLTEHLERIGRQAIVAGEVITGLSDFAKLELPASDSVPVPQLVAGVLAARDLPAGTTVELVGVDSCPPVRGDARQLAIVLGNLVGNAAEAMPHGGRLVVQAVAREGRVELTVSDSGPGIDHDFLYRIFEPFYTTKTRGMGLGLAMCRAIVENHGGEIRAERHGGPGARLTVSLPGVAEWHNRSPGDPSPES